MTHSYRSNTPPPVVLSFQERDGDPHSWYWEEHGGGMRLPAGKHKGEKIHDVSLGHLLWCHNNVSHSRWEQFHEAFDYYMDGLEALVDEEYGNFIVPLGTKHRGQKIRQCRDKEWFRWLCSRSDLVGTEKYRLFFMAVEKWLANPRKQEVKRDIGEALIATEYTDDLNLRAGNDDERGEFEDGDYEWDSDDRAFIDDSQQPDAATSESDRSSSDLEDRMAPEADWDADEMDLAGSSRQSTPTSQNWDDRQPERGMDEGSVSDEEEGTLESDLEESSKQLSLRSFVEYDTSENGEESYHDSESEIPAPLPSDRITRSRMKIQRRNDSHQPKTPSPSKIRSRKRNIIFSEQSSETSSVFDDQPLDQHANIHNGRASKILTANRDPQKISFASGNSTQLSLQSVSLTRSRKTRRRPKRAVSDDSFEANAGGRDTKTPDLDLAAQLTSPKPSKTPRFRNNTIVSSDDDSGTDEEFAMSTSRLTSSAIQSPLTKDLTIRMSRSSVNSPRRKRGTTVYSSESVSSDDGASPRKRRHLVSMPPQGGGTVSYAP